MDTIIIRHVESNDFFKGHLDLCAQLSHLDTSSISFDSYNEFVNTLKYGHGHHEVHVVEMDGKIVGTVTLLIETKLIHNMGKVAHVEDLVVDKNYRQHGLGKMLIQHAVACAKSNNCYKVILDCNDENVGFYQKCEFEKLGNMMAIYF